MNQQGKAWKIVLMSCGGLFVLFVGGMIFLGVKIFDKIKGNQIEVRGYESTISGTAKQIEIEHYMADTELSGAVPVHFKESDKTNGLLFEGIELNGTPGTLIIFSDGADIALNITGSIKAKLKNLFFQSNLSGELADPDAGTTGSNVPINGSSALASDAGAVRLRVSSVDVSSASGTISATSRAAFIAAGSSGEPQLTASPKFSVTSATRLYVSRNTRFALTSAPLPANDPYIAANISGFSGAVDIKDLHVSEKAAGANVLTRARNVRSLDFKKEGDWKVDLTSESFQVQLNDKVLIPATLTALPNSADVAISGDPRGGSTTIALGEKSGRGDAMIESVTVDGPAKDWVSVPKSKATILGLFEDLPQEVQPFFAIPLIISSAFLDPILLLLQPTPVPDAIFAGDTYKMVVSVGEPTKGAALPSDPTATITVKGKNFDAVTIKVNIREK